MYEVFDRLTVRAGTVIFTEGEAATIAHLIRSGSVEIFITRNGSDVLLAMRGTGKIIGEMAIIDAGTRSASVRAKEDCATRSPIASKTAIPSYACISGRSSRASVRLRPTIKIDRSFIRTMMTDPKQMKIVQMVLRLAEELGFSVVAEGIEQEAEAKTLEILGCAFGQGYLFGKPLPLDQTVHLTRQWIANSLTGADEPASKLRAACETSQATKEAWRAGLH